MFSQVAAEHPLPEDPSLLQLLLGGPGLHEGAQKGDQLPVLLGHCGGRGETISSVCVHVHVSTEGVKLKFTVGTTVKTWTKSRPTPRPSTVVHYGSILMQSTPSETKPNHITQLMSGSFFQLNFRRMWRGCQGTPTIWIFDQSGQTQRNWSPSPHIC